jgi:hypothetical protein
MAKMTLEFDTDDLDELVLELVKLRNRATKLMVRSENMVTDMQKMVDDMENFIHANGSES